MSDTLGKMMIDPHCIYCSKGPKICEREKLLNSKAPEMYELLKELEWSTKLDCFGSFYACPCCGHVDMDRHTSDCKLGNLLAELKELEG